MAQTSAILDIYNHFDALSVTVGGVTPRVYDMDELPNRIERAQLPARLLFPVGAPLSSGPTHGRYVTLDSIGRMAWRVRDLCLWRALGQGVGFRTIMPTLIDYSGKYSDALVAQRGILDNQAYIDTWQIVPTVIEWPDGSGAWYFAVDAVVDVIEYLTRQ